MVHILQPRARERGPSFGEKLSQGIGRGLEMGSQMMKELEDKESIKKENSTFKNLTGLDISGIKDPKMREKAFELTLQSKYKKEEMEGEQDFLGKIFNKSGSQSSDKGSKLQGYSEPIADDQPGSNNGNGFNPANISDEDIALLATKKPALAREVRSAKDAAITKLRDEKKEKQTQFQSDRDYHSKRSDKAVEKASAAIQKAPIRKGLINQQRRDIASGQTEGIIPFLVEKTGAEIYRNPESARFKTASKQRFIENLSSLGGGARPNMFIEQQLVGAQAALGRDAESNQTILDMEEFIDDLETQHAQYVREESQKDRDKFGYVREDVEERADKKMEKFAEQRQDQMAYDIRQRREANMSDEELVREIAGKHVVPDTPLTLRAARILMIKNNDDERKAQAESKKLGYRIPMPETYMRK